MKCDELKDYDIMDIEAIDDERIKASSNGKVVPLTRVYIKAEIDDAIAELKSENERLKGESCKLTDGCLRLKQCRREKANLADELRATKRALWISRAKRAIDKIAWFKLWNASISTMNPEDGARQEYEKWKKALGKLLKKAEEYK